MDVEQMNNISANVTFDPDAKYYIKRNYIVDIFLLIASITGVIADILIIYTIVKFKTLHTRTNTYLVNFCVLNSVYLTISPALLDLFSAGKFLEAYFVCFSDEVFVVLMIGNHVFICILILDWYITTYKSLNAAAKCRRSYKVVIATVWLVLLSLILSVVLQCTVGIAIYPLLLFFGFLFYFISMIFIAFLHLMKFINEKTTSVIGVKWDLELLFATLYLVCWLPNWLYFFLIIVFRLIPRVSVACTLCTFLIGYFYPTLLLVLLYFRDKQFRVCLDNIVAKKKILVVVEEEPPRDEDVSITLL